MMEMIGNFFVSTSTWLPQTLMLILFALANLVTHWNNPSELGQTVKGTVIMLLLLVWGGFFG